MPADWSSAAVHQQLAAQQLTGSLLQALSMHTCASHTLLFCHVLHAMPCCAVAVQASGPAIIYFMGIIMGNEKFTGCSAHALQMRTGATHTPAVLRAVLCCAGVWSCHHLLHGYRHGQ
jgi:hypothetical protein